MWAVREPDVFINLINYREFARYFSLWKAKTGSRSPPHLWCWNSAGAPQTPDADSTDAKQLTRPPSSPQCSLALQQVLQAQKPFLPLWPVGAGAVVENLCHILGLPQVMGNATVPGTVRAFRADTRGITVGIIVRIHPVGLIAPPHRLLLPGPTRDGGDGERSGKMRWPWVIPNKPTTNKELHVKRCTQVRCTTPACVYSSGRKSRKADFWWIWQVISRAPVAEKEYGL